MEAYKIKTKKLSILILIAITSTLITLAYARTKFSTESDLELAKTYVEDAMKCHQNWISILKRKPDRDTRDVGDIDHHRMWIERYRLILKVLEELG